jgi:(4-(4-[2-(gamma-L-glutamylamino)ethyl]phenoxymethyl)furan-2-yl)methanamine synthase
MILGLDIGGANLKAATSDGRAASVPFALWKQPEKLPAALADLIARFPDADELAVTMTGELCDCFETKREGVRRIVEATEHAGAGRRIRYWSSDRAFLSKDEAKDQYRNLAAANWHALATFAGALFAPFNGGLLIDIGSTTSDLIPLWYGTPGTNGSDSERLASRALVYTGIRRSPICSIITEGVAAELFATTQDVYVITGELPEEESNCDTADGRSLVRANSMARLARMLCEDLESLDESMIVRFAQDIRHRQLEILIESARYVFNENGQAFGPQTVIVSGSGEFLARKVAERVIEGPFTGIISITDHFGSELSAAAPAYAVARLAAERRP